MKFRKKPLVVEAVQYLGDNKYAIIEWAHKALPPEAQSIILPGFSNTLIIRTLEGEMTAYLMDWIIKGVKGEFYPCKHDIFEKTYESVE